MKQRILAAILFLGATLMAQAQSNAFIDSVIDSTSITTSQAAYLILVASDNLGDDSDAPRAYELMQQMGWVPAGLGPEDTITYSEFSHLLMKAFGIKGGILYQLFPGPRYGYRELRHLAVIQGATDPAMEVSGVAAMRLIGRVFDVKGVEK